MLMAQPGVSRAGIKGALCNFKGYLLFTLSNHVGVRDSNEAEVLVLLEALGFYSGLVHPREVDWRMICSMLFHG